MLRYPVYKPYLEGNERKYLNQALDSGWISSKGDFLSNFEAQFASYLDVESATAVSNGTVALHVILQALGVKQGDEVIVPTFTYIASVNAILYVGAIPVFVDSLHGSWNLDPEDVRRKVNDKTVAIMAVHLYGNPCRMADLLDICTEFNLMLLEDAAEAFGSKYEGRFVGSFGKLSTFSFFGNKTLTTGEGGMIVSNDSASVDRVAHLKSQAVDSQKEYWHDELGFNYRMTNLCAAIGVAQLEVADLILKRKRTIFSWYKKFLHNSGVEFQLIESNAESSYWMVSILCQSEQMRSILRGELKARGIETRPAFPLANRMPYIDYPASFPVADLISRCALNLPSYPALEEGDVATISMCIRDVVD